MMKDVLQKQQSDSYLSLEEEKEEEERRWREAKQLRTMRCSKRRSRSFDNEFAVY